MNSRCGSYTAMKCGLISCRTWSSGSSEYGRTRTVCSGERGPYCSARRSLHPARSLASTRPQPAVQSESTGYSSGIVRPTIQVSPRQKALTNLISTSPKPPLLAASSPLELTPGPPPLTCLRLACRSCLSRSFFNASLSSPYVRPVRALGERDRALTLRLALRQLTLPPGAQPNLAWCVMRHYRTR